MGTARREAGAQGVRATLWAGPGRSPEACGVVGCSVQRGVQCIALCGRGGHWCGLCWRRKGHLQLPSGVRMREGGLLPLPCAFLIEGVSDAKVDSWLWGYS